MGDYRAHYNYGFQGNSHSVWMPSSGNASLLQHM